MESDTALITGAFALGGVIVGGALNNWLSYTLERRREGWAGTKAARLLFPRIGRIDFSLQEAAAERWSWNRLCNVIESNLDGFWTEFADTITGTFAFEEWAQVYAAVQRLEHLRYTALRDGTRITEADQESLRNVRKVVNEAHTTLTVIAIYGPNRQGQLRRALNRARYKIRAPKAKIKLGS